MISARALVATAILALCGPAPRLHAAIKSEGIPDLRPPRGILEEPSEERSHWPFILAVGCLAVGVILLWPRKQRVTHVEAPAAVARRALQGNRHPGPVGLGQILRDFIIATHAVPGPGQTFEQLAAILAADPRWTPAMRERFKRLADPLEIAKFAPAAGAANLEHLREEALALIDEADASQRPPVPSRP
jgi:hypothetical protein